MKDNTSSVRAAAGRRGTACTKHGREAGEAAGSGGRGAVVSSAGDGAGWPAAASSPAGGSVGGEHWALLDRAGNLLVTHNQPLISSYNQQQHNNTIAFTDSWQCRAGAQWSQTSHAWHVSQHDSKDSGDTCCVRDRRRGQHEAGAGEQPDVRARYCHCHVSRVTCHVSRVTTPSLFMAHFPQLTLHTHWVKSSGDAERERLACSLSGAALSVSSLGCESSHHIYLSSCQSATSSQLHCCLSSVMSLSKLQALMWSGDMKMNIDKPLGNGRRKIPIYYIELKNRPDILTLSIQSHCGSESCSLHSITTNI